MKSALRSFGLGLRRLCIMAGRNLLVRCPASGPLAATESFPDQLVGEHEAGLGDLRERQKHLSVLA
ncbi:MAG: hypothetical protein JO094_04845, partial [Hyphomicrobiales bacterium]|nr:hypothetical protein [Hyphomicrobiales bacterium]